MMFEKGDTVYLISDPHRGYGVVSRTPGFSRFVNVIWPDRKDVETHEVSELRKKREINDL